MENKNMVFEGIEEDYRVYRNSEGFMEGYKAIGENKLGGGGRIGCEKNCNQSNNAGGFWKVRERP